MYLNKQRQKDINEQYHRACMAYEKLKKTLEIINSGESRYIRDKETFINEQVKESEKILAKQVDDLLK